MNVDRNESSGIRQTHSEEYSLLSDGYECVIACTHSYKKPDDFAPDNPDCGWSIRREMKRWAISHDYSDFVIFRNYGYQADLHGAYVYELYVKETPKNPCCVGELVLDVHCTECNMADDHCQLCRGSGYKPNVSQCGGCFNEFDDPNAKYLSRR